MSSPRRGPKTNRASQPKLISSAPRHLHRKNWSGFLARRFLEKTGSPQVFDRKGLDPAFLDPDMVWPLLYPPQAPSYTPTGPLRASHATLPVGAKTSGRGAQKPHPDMRSPLQKLSHSHCLCFFWGICSGVAGTTGGQSIQRQMNPPEKSPCLQKGVAIRYTQIPNVWALGGGGWARKGLGVFGRGHMENGALKGMRQRLEFDDRELGDTMPVQVGPKALPSLEQHRRPQTCVPTPVPWSGTLISLVMSPSNHRSYLTVDPRERHLVCTSARRRCHVLVFPAACYLFSNRIPRLRGR